MGAAGGLRSPFSDIAAPAGTQVRKRLAGGAAFGDDISVRSPTPGKRALTVTYLIPLFGLAWGALFLGESLPPAALAGGALILIGTAFVTRG